MLPAGPNKKIKRRAEQDTLLSRQQRKKNPASSVLSSPAFIFFPLRAFLFQICHSFLLSTFSQALAPFLTSSQGRNSHFFKRKASS